MWLKWCGIQFFMEKVEVSRFLEDGYNLSIQRRKEMIFPFMEDKMGQGLSSN